MSNVSVGTIENGYRFNGGSEDDPNSWEKLASDHQSGNASRGFKEAFQQVPQLGYGVLAGIGATGENVLGSGGIMEAIKKYGVKNYNAASQEIAKDARENDEWDTAWQKTKQGDLGAIGDWAAHGTGYVAGQLAQVAATSLAGAAIGSAAAGPAGAVTGGVAGAVEGAAVKTGVKTLVGSLMSGMVEKEAAKLAGQNVAARLSADEILNIARNNVARSVGSNTALLGHAAGMEGGEIFGATVSEAEKEGRKLSGTDLLRAGAATTLATAGEFVGEKIGLSGLSGKLPLGKTIAEMGGVKGRLTRGALGASVIAPGEYATEYGQTLAEEWGKGKDPFSDESFRQAHNAGMMGTLGGAIAGGGGGVMAKRSISEPDSLPQTNATSDPLPADINAANATAASAMDAYQNPAAFPRQLTDNGAINLPTPESAGLPEIAPSGSPIQRDNPLLRAYPTAEAAQDDLNARPDADFLSLIPHPNVEGNFALVPKSAPDIAQIQTQQAEAMAREAAQTQNEARTAQINDEEQSREQEAKAVQSITELQNNARALEQSIAPNTPPGEISALQNQASALRTQAESLQRTALEGQRQQTLQRAQALATAPADVQQAAQAQALATEASQAELAPAAVQALAPLSGQPLSERSSARITAIEQRLADISADQATRSAPVQESLRREAAKLAQEKVKLLTASTTTVPLVAPPAPALPVTPTERPPSLAVPSVIPESLTPTPMRQAEQVALPNPALFEVNAGVPSLQAFSQSPYPIHTGHKLIHEGRDYTVTGGNAQTQTVIAESANPGKMPATVRFFKGDALHRARYEALYGQPKPPALTPEDNDTHNARVIHTENAARIERLQADSLIQQASGKPFKTAASAQAFSAQNELDDTHAVTPVETGFALRRLGEAARPSALRANEERNKNDPQMIRQEASFSRAEQLGEPANKSVFEYSSGHISIEQFEAELAAIPSPAVAQSTTPLATERVTDRLPPAAALPTQVKKAKPAAKTPNPEGGLRDRNGYLKTKNGYTIAPVKGQGFQLLKADGSRMYHWQDGKRGAISYALEADAVQHALTLDRHAPNVPVKPKPLTAVKKTATARQLNPSRDSLLMAIAKLGGLRTDEVIGGWGHDPADFKRGKMMGFGLPVLRKMGLSPDAMREALAQHGYLHEDAPLADFQQKFAAELAGQAHYTTAALERQAEQQSAEQDAEQARSDLEIGDLSAEDYAQSGYDDLSATEQSEVDTVITEALSVLGEGRVEDLKEVLALRLETATPREFQLALKEKLNEEIAYARNRETAVPNAAGTTTENSRRSEQDAGPETSEKDRAAAPEGLVLQGQTPAQAAAEHAQQQAEPELSKRQIDREAEHFSLSGQSQANPKQAPTGGQSTLFTVDGRATQAAQTTQVKKVKPAVNNIREYKGWKLFDELPSGWIFDRETGSPLYGYLFATDGKSILRGGKRALVRWVPAAAQNPIRSASEGRPLPESEWLSVGAITDHLEKLSQPFGTTIPVTVIDRPGDIGIASHPDDVGTSGITVNGRIYLVREGLVDGAATARTFWHELLHFGLRRFLTREQYVTHLSELYASDDWIRNKADAWIAGGEGRALHAKGDSMRYIKARGVDEALAGLAELLQANPSGYENNSLKSKAIRAVRSWVASLAEFFGNHEAAKAWRGYAAQGAARDLVASTFAKLREGTPPSMLTTRWHYSDPAFMTAYHGSPHDHDQFSTAHIGSGEGAQAKGWGLYFAGNKEVAEYYRDNVIDRKFFAKINARMSALSEVMNTDEMGGYRQYRSDKGRNAALEYDKLLEERAAKKSRLYTVELAPKEDEYLDWDKPLSEQSKFVNSLIVANPPSSIPDGKKLGEVNGKYVYTMLLGGMAEKFGVDDAAKSASEFLHSLGIRGIRYLDNTRRGASEGSSNYVIFNDADVSITAKFSRQRADAAETAADRHTRLAAESNAKKAARQTGPVVPLHTKTADEQTINEAGGIRDAQVVDQNQLPNANQANGGVSRQAAEFISTVARLFNKRVVFFTSAALKADGLWTLGDTLFINAHSHTAPLRVLGHELTHAMERESPKAYAQMMQSVQHLLTDEQLMDQHSDYFGESLADAQALDAPYQGTTMREFLAKEWMADLSGNRFSETSFWNDLFTGIEAQQGSATAKSIVTRLRMAFLNVLAKLKSFVQGQAYGVDARLADHLEAIRLAVKDGFIAYEQAAKQGALVAVKKGKSGVNFSQASKIPSGIVSVVPILTQNITGVDHPVSNKQLREISDGLLQSLRIEMAAGKSPLVNRQTGWQFSISANDARKMGNNPHMKPESSKAVVYARELISAAILAETHADTQGHQSEAVHRFYAPALIDGKLYRVRLTVLDYQESSGKRNLHAIQAVEIENALPGTLPATDTSVDAVTLAQPTTGRTISIDQLLQGAKREDGSLFSRQRAALGPLTPEQTAAAQHVLGTPKTLLQRLQDFKKDWAMNLKQGIFDQFAPIMALNPQAYWLARLSKGGDSTLEALMMYGKLSLGADGSTQAQYTKAGGLQGFAPQMAKLKGEHDRFFLWVASLRADRLKGIGLENLWSADDITHLKTLNAGAMLDGTMRPPLYAAALQQLNDFNDNILEIAEKSGLIDTDTRQLYKDQPYIPFYRLNEDDQVNGFNIKPGLVNQTAWKKLKGGTDKLNEDLMANLLQNWSHLITASAKNRAAKATLEAAAAIGVAESIPSGAPGKGHVSYREGGKEKAFILSDPHLMDAVAALHYAGLGDLAKPFTLAKYFLTIGVTANPAFKIRNLIRDTLASIGTSSLSANPARNLKQGWTATAKESETRAQMMAGGGMIRFGSMLDGKNAQRAQDLIHEGVLPEHILDSPSKIAQFWKKTGRPALNAYNELGDRLEQVNRAALYEQLLAKGISPTEAAFQARDLMDFQMGGQWAAVRLLTQTVPFMNARLQGLYKLGRATKEDYKRVGTVVGAVALASLGLLLAYQDDEDWKARSEADRNNYWWFKVDGKAYRVPKPFEIGAIGTLAERGYEKMFDPEMTNKRFGGVMRDLVMSQLSMNPVPQLVKPLADIYANKDNFSGAPIEGLGMEKLKKADRLTSKTSEVARFLGGLGLPNPAQLAMGRWESLSPVQIDYLAKAYFSWLGTMTTTVLDYGIRPMMNRGERPEMKLKEVFLVGNFVESLPASGSRYVTQMYDQAKEIEQAYSSYKHLLKLGDLAGAKEALAEDHDLIVRYPATEALKELESKISAQMRRVEASTTMSPAQKRIQLDTLTIKRNQVALNFKAR